MGVLRGARTVGVVAVVAGMVALGISSIASDDSRGPVAAGDRDADDSGPLFDPPSGVTLVFDDGIDGVTAVDLDRGVAVRQPVPGQRAGDQDPRLARSGDSLIVGWGEVSVWSLADGASRVVGEATVSLPAAEEERAWLVDYPGGRIGSGTPTVRQVDLDGVVHVTATGLDPGEFSAAAGIPGGLAYESSAGVVLWDAMTGAVTDRLGTGQGWVSDVVGDVLVWCDGACAELHVSDLDGGDDLVIAPPEGSAGWSARSARLSPDGSHVGAVTADGSVAIADLAQGAAKPITSSAAEDTPLHLGWSPDGQQLFFSTGSYGRDSTVLGRFRLGDERAATVRIGVGGLLAFVTVSSNDYRDVLVPDDAVPGGCGTPGGYPSNRTAPCRIADLSVTDDATFAVAAEETATPSAVDVLPPPPLDVRWDVAITWTGAELVVWGGDVEAANMGVSGPDRSYDDGAAFDPATRTWRLLSTSPLEPAQYDDRPVAATTDAGVVVVRGRSTAVWNPTDDTWRKLDDAPAPVDDLLSTGALAITSTGNAILDLATGRWHELPAPPVELARPTSAWTGRELIVVGGPRSPFTSAAAIAYDIESNEWRQLADPPGDLHAEALSASWDGDRLVVVNYDMRAVTYDPSTDTWTDLPPVPARFYEWTPSVRSVGGTSVVFMAAAVVVLDEADRWTPLAYDTLPRGLVTAQIPSARTGSEQLTVFGVNNETETNVLSTIDVVELARDPDHVQVGVFYVALPDGLGLVDAALDEAGEVHAELEHTDGRQCTITSGHNSPPLDDAVTGEVAGWARDETGRVWRTTENDADAITIECTETDIARTLAESARRFAGQ